MIHQPDYFHYHYCNKYRDFYSIDIISPTIAIPLVIPN